MNLRVVACASYLFAASMVGDSRGGNADAPRSSAAGSSLVYVRVKGQPDLCLVSPGGKTIRAAKGVVLQNDFPGQAEAYSVPPTTQLAFKDPPAGRWKLRIRGSEQQRLIVSVARSLDSGRVVCDAVDTVLVEHGDDRWWDVRWSEASDHDTCWVRLTRTPPEDRRRAK
jgi:hypothetical protein